MQIDFPLRNLSKYFSDSELRFIFGNMINDPYFFEEIENDNWSSHLVVKTITESKFVGYIRLVAVKDIVEIHGGGISNSFLDKVLLSEAWLLMIKWCFKYFQVNSVYSSCMLENKKAYKFITGTGFQEIFRDHSANRINFILTIDAYQTNNKFRFIGYD